MTTVAFRAGIMACDSCFSLGNSIDTLSTKIARLKSGALLGQAGANDARPIFQMLQSAKTVSQLPSLEALMALRFEFLGLLILPAGRIFKLQTSAKLPQDNEDDDLGLWEIERDFTAIGTGTDFAVGAMEAGASARQAVRIACRNDLSSRLPVHTLFLGGKK